MFPDGVGANSPPDASTRCLICANAAHDEPSPTLKSNGFDFLRASRFRFFASMDFMRPQYVGWQVIGTIFPRELFLFF
jgi:hypothetical protein